MHELSIALEILDIVEREAAGHGARAVKEVNLRVGDLSGVETGSLVFSFDAVKGDRELTREALLVIERLPVRIRCHPCNNEFSADVPLVLCPRCGGLDTELLQGDELEISDIEID